MRILLFCFFLLWVAPSLFGNPNPDTAAIPAIDSLASDMLSPDSALLDSIAPDSLAGPTEAEIKLQAALKSMAKAPRPTHIYREGLFYDTDGTDYVITRKHIEFIHPVNFIDLLDHLPGIEVARNSFLGTLSDLKSLGEEALLFDKPVTVEVDGMEVSGTHANQVYLTGISVADVERVVVERGGGGIYGSEILIRIITRDQFAVDPAATIFWENGPFEMSVFRFGFRRRLGEKTGFYLSTEKVFMFEGDGFYTGQRDKYSHPAAIVDIYRSFLDRPDSEYVAEGFKFENFSRNWDLRINTLSFPGINLNAGFEFSADAQDDFRLDPREEEIMFLDFSTRHRRERFYLAGRTLHFDRMRMSGVLFRETSRMYFPSLPAKGVSRDSTFYAQGAAGWGGRLKLAFEGEQFSWAVNTAANLDTLKGDSLGVYERAEQAGTQLSYRSTPGNIPVTLKAGNTIRRNTRFFFPGRE